MVSPRLVAWSSRAPSDPFVPITPVDGGPLTSEGASAIALSRDGGSLLTAGVTASKQRFLAVLNVPGFDVRSLSPPAGRASYVEASADGNRAALLEGATFRVWEAVTNRVLARHALADSESHFVSIVHVSPDGTRMLWARRYLSMWATAPLPR